MTKINFANYTYTDHFAQRAQERFEVSKGNVVDWILENKNMVVDERTSDSIIATDGDGLFFVCSSQSNVLKTCYFGVKQKQILKIKDKLLKNVEESILDAKIQITREIVSSSENNINNLNNINLRLSTMDPLFEIKVNNGTVFDDVLDLYNSSVNAVKNKAKRLKKENENLEEFLGRVKQQHNQINDALKQYKDLKPVSEFDCLHNNFLFANDGSSLEDCFTESTDLHSFSDAANVNLELLKKEEVNEFSEASDLFPVQEPKQEKVYEINRKEDDNGYLYEKEKLFATTVAKGIDSVGDLKFSLLGGRMFTNLLNELIADKVDKKIREQISKKKCGNIQQFEVFSAKKVTKNELHNQLYKNIMSRVFEAFAKTGFIDRGYKYPDETDIKEFEAFVKETLKPYLKSKSLKKVQDLYASMPFEGFIVNVLDIDGVGKGTKEKLIDFQFSLVDGKVDHDEFGYFIS